MLLKLQQALVFPPFFILQVFLAALLLLAPLSLAHMPYEPLSPPQTSMLWLRASLLSSRVEMPALPTSLTVELQLKAALTGWSLVGLVWEMKLPSSAGLTMGKTCNGVHLCVSHMCIITKFIFVACKYDC